MNWFIEDLFNVIISFATDTYSMMMAAVYSFGQIQAGSHPDVTVVEAVMTALMPFAIALVLCYGAIEIITGIIDSNQGLSSDPMALIIRVLLRLFFSYVLIGQSYNIANGVFYMWNSFGKLIHDTATVATQTATASPTMIVVGIIEKMFTMGTTALVLLITQLVAIGIMAVNILMARVELEARMALLPVGIANVITSGGINNSGFKYIKRIMGCALYWGGCMLIISIVSGATQTDIVGAVMNEVQTGNLSNIGTSIIQTVVNILIHSIVGPFAAVSACSTMKSILNEALGG